MSNPEHPILYEPTTFVPVPPERLQLMGDFSGSIAANPNLQHQVATYFQSTKPREYRQQLTIVLRDSDVYNHAYFTEFLGLLLDHPQPPPLPAPELSLIDQARQLFPYYARSTEFWNDLHFYYEHENYSFNLEPHLQAEATAIGIVAASRAKTWHVVEAVPTKWYRWTRQAGDYYLDAYQKLFGHPAPVDPAQTTHLSTRIGHNADLVGRQAYLDIQDVQNRSQLVQAAVHENLHLSFGGMSFYRVLEESLIEIVREKMFHCHPTKLFNFVPTDPIYDQWVISLKSIFKHLPKLEPLCLDYFGHYPQSSLQPIRAYLAAKISGASPHDLGIKHTPLLHEVWRDLTNLAAGS